MLYVHIVVGEKNKEVYFFVKKEERERKGRETLAGYWEECEEEEIMEAGDRGYNECIHLEGRRKTFAFYIGKRPRGTITTWIMYEFRLLSSRATRWSSSSPPQVSHKSVSSDTLFFSRLCNIYILFVIYSFEIIISMFNFD